jgi:hypothetical protein
MTHAEMIEVIKAHSEGRAIQWRRKGFAEWSNVSNPKFEYFNFSLDEYRLKPEPPKPREVFLFPHGGYPGGLSTSPPYCEHVSKPIKFREVLDE